jgi:lysophospholipase
MKLHPTLENRLPEGALCHDVTTSDGLHLRAVTLRQHKARATIFVLNGRAEYVERYFETMKELAQRGFAVISFDWRGQGGSQRVISDHLRGYVRSFADYDMDLSAIVGLASRLDFPEPYYALGHSTGGNILLRALRHRTWFKRVVITAPLLGFHFGKWPMPVVKLLTFVTRLVGAGTIYLPGLARGPLKRDEFPNNPLTSDRGRWNRDIATLEQHPELGVGGPTYGWLGAAMKSISEIYNWPSKKGPSCPTMIIIAGRDRVVDSRATREFVDQVPGFTLLSIDDSLHEILMEKNVIRQRFWAAFDTFMGLET